MDALQLEQTEGGGAEKGEGSERGGADKDEEVNKAELEAAKTET